MQYIPKAIAVDAGGVKIIGLDRGRIRYDERMLMDALTREQPDIDYGYVERYVHA